MPTGILFVMSKFDDIFGSFFGSGFRHGGERVGPFTDDSDQTPFHGFFSCPGSFRNDDDDASEGLQPGGHGPFPGGGGFNSFNNEMNDMFRLFDDMFKSFGMADFPSMDVPRISPPPSAQPEMKSPRDHMLKEPDSTDSPEPGAATPNTAAREPLTWFDELRRGKTIFSVPPEDKISPSASEKKDSDLDDVIKQGEMERIFGGRSSRHPSSDQRQNSYSRSISIQTIRKPDGTYETRRTERDGQGNVTTTVTSGSVDAPASGQTDPRNTDPWGMHHWGPSIFWPFTKRCPGHDRLEGEGSRTEGGQDPWRPGMSWPESRRSPGPDMQERETDDSVYKKFFGSWFKH